jgi:hypothetical protein
LNPNGLLLPWGGSLKGGGSGGDVRLAQGHPNDTHGEIQSDFLIFFPIFTYAFLSRNGQAV